MVTAVVTDAYNDRGAGGGKQLGVFRGSYCTGERGDLRKWIINVVPLFAKIDGMADTIGGL
jgi:hypothetical protein